jgi:S-adenosylmethionine:tRNA ribosyltransferase-isomerase
VFEDILNELGHLPLPPYIHETPEDENRYQTVYAKETGSAAAPTAGLHFTPELLQSVRDKGVAVAEILLHVGLGTFRPVKVENVQEHVMHAEYFEVTQQAADTVNERRSIGGRVVSVGTTTTRVLESVHNGQEIVPRTGETDIFIYPGYDFKAADVMLTNFHLPQSTLIMMVSAFAGYDTIKRAYETAVREKYRFFSFGDCMLIV